MNQIDEMDDKQWPIALSLLPMAKLNERHEIDHIDVIF